MRYVYEYKLKVKWWSVYKIKTNLLFTTHDASDIDDKLKLMQLTRNDVIIERKTSAF